MAELQRVNHLLEVDNHDNDVLAISQFDFSRFKGLKPTEASETLFLENTDKVVIVGDDDNKYIDKKQTNKGSIDYKLYSSTGSEVYSYLDIDITRETDGNLRFAENIHYNDKENVLYLDNHVIGVPKGSDVYLYPLFVMIQLAGKRLIIYWSEKKITLENKDYRLSNNDESNIYIDDDGNIAINYLETIAAFRFNDRKMDVNGYHLNLEDKKQEVVISGKWIKLSNSLQFNAEEGVVRYQHSYVKVPRKSELTFNSDELRVATDANVNLSFLAQVDRLVFRESSLWLVFDINSRIVLDRRGGIAFLHQDNLAVLDKSNNSIRVAEMVLNIAEGSIVRVTKDNIHLNEVVKVNPEEKTVKVAKSKFLFSGKVEVSTNKAETVLQVNDKQIKVMPYKKQLFINIGGKLVIVTVSIGIAVDGNGNIAFDYQNNLTTLDTDYFVMNLGGSIFSFGSLEDCSCEFLGDQVAVGSQKQNVLELLKTMLASDLSEVLTKYDLQSLIESLLCTEVSSFLNSNSLVTEGVDINVLMDLVKGNIFGRITATGESCFAIMNKNNMEQVVMGENTYPIVQGNNFYVPINMEFLQGKLKFKDNKVYFVG